MTLAEPTSITDGRRARRDRNRTAVIDAMFELVTDGVIPSTEALAERAGVSVSSVFRYFDSIDDLIRQTIDVHLARHGSKFAIPGIGVGARAERIDRLVTARVELYTAVAPVARLARSRAFDQPTIATELAGIRLRSRRQTRDHFALELGPRTTTQANDLVDVIDTVTSFEAWDLLTQSHHRTPRQIGRAWNGALTTLLAD